MLFQYKGTYYNSGVDFRDNGGDPKDSQVRFCAYDMAMVRDVMNMNGYYPKGSDDRAMWERRIADSGVDGEEGFRRALRIAKEIRFPSDTELKSSNPV